MPLNWVEIDLAALRNNFYLAGRLAPGSRIIGVVKSDAYGHGMVPVARELEKCGAGFLAVGKFHEALDLRQNGIELPVLVLLGIEPEDAEEAIRLGIRPAIFRLDHAKMMSEAARNLNMPARVHVKLDTGMGRLGVPCGNLAAFAEQIKLMPGVVVEGILSHFAEADEADRTFCDFQIERFTEAIETLSRQGLPFSYAHISNSAGVIGLPRAHYHLVRPGIMLYGSHPSGGEGDGVGLQPVMSFKSRIMQLKEVAPGHPIGYGRTFTTQRQSRIATVPVGYDDGYFRALSNKGRALVRGKSAPLVGRVSMNLITLDMTDIPDAREDDEVVLLGRQGDERIAAEEIAGLGGTISYEVYCAIGKQQRFKFFLNASGGERPA